MPVRLPEPHAKKEVGNETLPLWKCPHCKVLKKIEQFGFRRQFPGIGEDLLGQ